MQKRAPEAMVAQKFTHAHPLVMQPGDLVQLTGDMTVDTLAGPAGVIGEIVTINVNDSTCVVELQATKIKECVAVGAITPGKQVKLGNAANKVSAANTVTTAADIPLVFGICLNNVADAGTAFIMMQ